MSISQHLVAFFKKIYKGLQTFLRNLRDIFRFSLKDFHRATKNRWLDDDLLIETIMYEIPNSPIKRPKIKTAEETISELLSSNKSIVRFGDGEIILTEGGGDSISKT